MAKWTKSNNPHTWKKKGRIVGASGRGGSLVVVQSAPPAPRGGALRRAGATIIERVVTRRSGGGGAVHVGARVRKGVAVTGFILGYASKNHAATIEKLPSIGGSRMITLALILHFLAKKRPGSYVDHAATAATAIAAFNLGEKGLGALTVAGVAGEDDARAYARGPW